MASRGAAGARRGSNSLPITTPDGASLSKATIAYSRICASKGLNRALNWLTILATRENFRAAFHGFDFDRIAGFTDADVERLWQDAGIVRPA